MQKSNDKATMVYEKVLGSRTPKGIWEHIKNEQSKAEMKKKIEADLVPFSPDYVQDHINWPK